MRLYDKLSALQKALPLKNADLARGTGLDPAAVSRFFLGKRPLPLKYLPALCDAIVQLQPDGVSAEILPLPLQAWTGSTGLIAPAKLSEALFSWLTEDLELEEEQRKEEKRERRKASTARQASEPHAKARAAAHRLSTKGFAEKLSLLMDVTGLTGSMIASALHVDTTLIYKYRMGTRFPSLKDDTIPVLSDYIGRHIRDAEQREQLLTAAGFSLPESKVAPEDMGLWLERWFLETRAEDTSTTWSFLESVEHFNYFAFKDMLIPLENIAPLAGDVLKNESFWGIAGMRDAATRYLYYAALQEKPVTLCISTTASLDFLTKDPYWKIVWGSLMVHCLQKGHTIKIIYNMADRTIPEIMDAIEAFVPLYMTGTMEPYTFKKPQGLTVRNTIFLIEDQVVVTANYAEGLDDEGEYLYSTEPQRLAVQKKHFDALLQTSRSLMDIYRRENDREVYLLRLGRFWVRPGDATLLLPSLSLGTMPEALLLAMLSRVNAPLEAREKIRTLHASAALWLRRQLNVGRLDEITLSTPEAAIDNKGVYADIQTHLLPESISYTQEEYATHLAHIRELERAWPNYRLHTLPKEEPFRNIKVFHKNSEVIVEKIGDPAAAFAIENIPMCQGFAQLLTELKEASVASAEVD